MYVILLAPLALVVGIVLDTMWDYVDYRAGRVGWTVLPRSAQWVWQKRHPDEGVVEFRGKGDGVETLYVYIRDIETGNTIEAFPYTEPLTQGSLDRFSLRLLKRLDFNSQFLDTTAVETAIRYRGR